MTGSTRTADIVADTELDTIVIPRNKFVNFVSGTEFGKVLQRVIDRRDIRTWNLLAESPAFQRLSDYQRMWLESYLEPLSFPDPGTILAKGDELPGVYVVVDGVVEARDGDGAVHRVERGQIIGMLHRIMRGEPAHYSYSNRGAVKALFMNKADALELIDRNPGLAMRFGEVRE
jgi:signal-transduction protein with cAMP-binding, CBS, and nucleotidyltransferase domain